MDKLEICGYEYVFFYESLRINIKLSNLSILFFYLFQ